MLEELTEDIIKKEKYAYEKIIRMMSHEVNNSIGAINSILNSVKSYAPQLQEDSTGRLRRGAGSFDRAE